MIQLSHLDGKSTEIEIVCFETRLGRLVSFQEVQGSQTHAWGEFGVEQP